MSKARQLIEKAIGKKPLDVREIIEDIMQEKVRGVIAESMDSFDYEGEALTEEEEMNAFFEEFNAEYGHLPMEEQEEIMNSLMSDELTEEDEAIVDEPMEEGKAEKKKCKDCGCDKTNCNCK